MHGKQPLKDAHFGTIHNQNQNFSPKLSLDSVVNSFKCKFPQAAMARVGQTIS